MIDDKTRLFLNAIWRGGRWANYCTFVPDPTPEDPKNARCFVDWMPALKAKDHKKTWRDVYMCVHPRREMLTGGARGGNKDVALINCTFADCDKKDGWTLEKVEAITPPASAIIDSGGGFHVYHFLKDTVYLTDANREEIRKLQSRWVAYVKADPNSADIAHILRVPGTFNHKKDYPEPRPVKFIRANFGTRYTLDELRAALPVEEKPKYTPPPKTYTPTYQSAGDQADRAACALRRLAPWRCHDKKPWIAVGLALSELGAVGLQLWEEWSQKDAEKYHAGECARRWETFKPGAGLTLGSLFWMADQDDPQPKKNESQDKTPMHDFIDTPAIGTDELDMHLEEPPESPPLPPGMDGVIIDPDPAKNGNLAGKNGKTEATQNKTSNFEEMGAAIGPIKFCWDPWLPEGMLTILASVSGMGKSIVVMRIVGSFIKRLRWPDSTPFDPLAGCVLWCEAEAAQALNFERAKLWGYPMNKILTPFADPLTDVNLDNDAHLAAITSAAYLPEVKLIVIDSLSGSTNKKENETEIKRITEYLARLARDTGKPVLLTHHLNKPNRAAIGGNEVTLDRLRGSSAIVQHARVVWALDAPDPEDQATKRLTMIKNNLRKFAPPIGITINDGGVNFVPPPTPPHQETVAERAAELLNDLMKDGPVLSKELESDCKANGISWATANRVKKEMGYIAYKVGADWYWKLT